MADASEQLQFVYRLTPEIVGSGVHGPFEIAQLVEPGNHQDVAAGSSLDFWRTSKTEGSWRHDVQQNQAGLNDVSLSSIL